MKAHRTDVMSLAFGMLFLVIALAYLANREFDVNLPGVGVFFAAGIVILGAVIAVTALFPHRKEKAVAPPAAEEQAEVDENP